MILRILKWLLKGLMWTSIGVVGFLLLVLLFTQTPIFRNLLRSRVTSILNEELNAKVRIEEIDGNVFGNLTVRGIELIGVDDNQPLASVDELSLSYSLLPLLDRKVVVGRIGIVHPRVRIAADSAGLLNWSKIAKPSEPKPQKPVDSSATPLGGFSVHLGEFAIEGGEADLAWPGFVRTVRQLNVRISADVDEQTQDVRLERFGFRMYDATGKDSLTLRNFGLSVLAHALPSSLHEQGQHPERVDSLTVQVRELHLLTDRSDVFLRASLLLPDSARGVPLQYDAEFRALPFHLDDIRGFADIGMKDLRSIELETRAKGDDRGVLLSGLVLNTPAGSLRGYAGVDYGEGPLGYKTDLSFRSINVSAFADRPDLYANLNGRIQADGLGTDPNTLRSNLNLTLYKSRFYGIDIDSFMIDAHVASGRADLSRFEGRTSAGSFNSQGFYNLLTEEYHLETRLQSINIADLIGDVSMQSSINLVLVYDGKGLNPKTSSSRVSVISQSSRILDRDVDQLTITGSQIGGRVRLDEMRLKTPLADLSVAGSIGLDSTVDLGYTLESRDLSLLKKYIGSDSLLRDTLNLHFRFQGLVRGDFGNIRTSGELVVTEVVFADVRLDSLRFTYYFDNIRPSELAGEASFKRIDSTVFGDIFLYARHTRFGGSTVTDFTTAITKERNRTLFEVSGHEDSVDAYVSVKGSVAMESEMRGELDLEHLYLRIAGRTIRTREVMKVLGGDPVIDTTYEKWVETWQNKDPVRLAFDADKNVYDVRSFNMDIGKGFVSLSGRVDVSGDQNVDLKVKEVDLSRINGLIGSGESVVEGLLNLNASLKGSFEKPIMIADWNISDGKASEFVYNNFLGNMQYLNRKLQLNMTLNQNKDKTLTMGGYLPLDLTFKDVPNRFTNRPINFIIHSEGIDLRFLQAFFGKALTLNRGELKVDLKITGNKEKPVIQGEMKIEDGTITFPRSTLGQTFRNTRMFVRLTPEKFFLDTLVVQSGKEPTSRLFADAEVNLSDVMKNFDFANFEKIGYRMNLAFQDFVPVNTRSETSYLHTARITGEMTIAAPTLYFTNIKGDLQIRNSEIWVVDPTRAKAVTTVASKKDVQKTQKQAQDFYKNLDMDLMISLPENSDNSIRSAEMTLSLYGEIGVNKPAGSEEFFISGNVNTKKGGKYAYLNVAFTIEKGEVNFTGEPGVNPQLDILAVKRFEFKDEDGNVTPSEAQIKVTGKLLKPEIAITAVERGTGDPIAGLTEPQDILSYLVLGVTTRDLNKLGASQAGDFAKQVAINQILNLVANKAGLQKLEFTQGTGGQSSSIAVSKRINETLSVSYEGGLDVSSGQTITLEISADSIPGLRSILGRTWKKTIEFEYKRPAQDKTLQQEDIINILLYFRKDY